MPSNRLRRLVQGQGGSTFIELLIAMPIAVVLLGLVVQALGNAGLHQQDVEHRTEALSNAQIGLERMTVDVRQADWVYFRNSSVVDVLTPVRSSATATATMRIVRWDCTGEVCLRREGPATGYPPPTTPLLTKTETVIGAPSADSGARYGLITGHDIFFPQRLDPSTGVSTTDFLQPDFLLIRLRLEVEGHGETIVIEDGTSLRNRTNYAG